MARTLTPSEQLAYSTVRIECQLNDGTVGTGTGFFFRFLDEGERHVPAIVTNKHVVSGAREGRFHLTLRDANGDASPGNHIRIDMGGFEARWIGHPNDQVDLAIMPIAPLMTEAQSTGRNFFFIALDRSLILTSEELAALAALEDIVMIGYPNGIWDSINNQPIIRRGITATHPNLDYEAREELLIDAACFPGSSGSPVFLYNVGAWATREGAIVGGSRIKLLGVLYAGPQHTATGEVQVVAVPTQQRVVAVSSIPNNLGMVIKARRLLEFDEVLRPRT